MSNTLKQVDIIILGSGISGLTLGFYLQKKNKDFLIFDSSKSFGGNISTKNKKGFICENGPNTVLINNESVKDLISDLKIKNDVIYPNNNNNKRFLIKKGKLIKIPQSFGQFIMSSILPALMGIIGNKRMLMFLICSTMVFKTEFIFFISVFFSDQGSESLKYLLESNEYSITCLI